MLKHKYVGFPFEHPIDSIKTQWQAKPYIKNEFIITREIYKNKGFKGFYAGSIPNLTRCIIKNTYKYPVLVGLPNFCKAKLPYSLKERKVFLKLLTGFSIAFIEATLTCPVERLKVYFMTRQGDNKLTYREFFVNNQQNLFKELFRGYTPLFMRQAMSWIVLLQTDLLVKKNLRKAFNIHSDKEISSKLLIPASFFVALVNTAMVMPLDCVKTHLEKVNPSETYLNTFNVIYNQGGMLGFFTGFRLRFLLYLSNSLFIVNLLEKFDTIAKMIKN